MAESSYPTAEVRGRSQEDPCLKGGSQEELPHVRGQGQWPRVPGCNGTGMAERSYPSPRSGVVARRTYPASKAGTAAERSYPVSKVRGGQEEPPHVQGRGGGREEQCHV